MANICCDDVYFYSDQYPERLQFLWNDLKASIILPSQNPDNCWIGNLFQYKKFLLRSSPIRGSVLRYDYDGALSFWHWKPVGRRYMRPTSVLPIPTAFLLLCAELSQVVKFTTILIAKNVTSMTSILFA